MDSKLLAGIFLEGILSFVSPCVLPLIPLYMSYLAADRKQTAEDGTVHYDTFRVFVMTVFFVLGISLTFVLLALSMNAFRDLFDKYREVIALIGGTLLIVFGLHETGLIHIDVLDRELKPRFHIDLSGMNAFKAFLLGFLFSLGWSPCIGPLLANALLLSATESGGYLYIVAYAAGLIIPFLLCGLFTAKILDFIKEKKNIFRYVLIISGIILIGYGCYMIYDAAERISTLKEISETTGKEDEPGEDIVAYLNNYEFTDTDGNTVKLSDYAGRYVFLNFTTTWCTYCKLEMPYYHEFAESEDRVCLYVMSPKEEYGGEEDILSFVKENEIKLPVLIDREGVLFYYCAINSFPTTFVLSPTGDYLAYFSGMLDKEGFESLLEYAKGFE